LYTECIDDGVVLRHYRVMERRNIKWDKVKNDWLKVNRSVSFESVVAALEADKLIDDVAHPKKMHQRIMIVEINHYICAVPYVTNEEIVFLKTIYPDRKMKVRYRNES
jgi:uncharacterized DUF497 family protein